MTYPDLEYGYFFPRETQCKCGCGGDIKPSFRDRLNTLRVSVDVPLVITSGFRCKRYNKLVGGVPNSMHLIGLAADIRWSGS